MAETIKTWADQKGIGVSTPKQWLRQAFPAQAKSFTSPDHKLTTEEHAVLEAEWPRYVERATLPDAIVADDEPTDTAGSLDLPLAISTASEAPIRLGAHQPHLWLHSDFIMWLADAPRAQRNAALRAMEMLVAHDRPNRVKGTHGPNAGWLRTPVGGTSGKQWYLWYAGRGAKPIGERIGSREYLIRAVRHHDETSDPIQAGDSLDWMPWTPRELLEEAEQVLAGSEKPLSYTQDYATRSVRPVQLVRGTPGAGKTTTLLHSVRHLSGKVLYLTFGSRLAARAKEWLDVFGNDQEEVRVLQFSEFAALLAGCAASADPINLAVAKTMEHALMSRAQNLGPWRTETGVDHELLYAELHAQIFGRGALLHFGEEEETRRERRVSSAKAAYLTRREPDIGESAARCAWDAAEILTTSAIESLFPGPLVAAAARNRLQSNTAPVELTDFDWIVVDEVQDLTFVEMEMVFDYARRVALIKGKKPGIRVGGDEGQTLRPTGFSWADLKTLARIIAEPEEILLDANVRSTREVAALIQRVTDVTYPKLPKLIRPCGQRRAEIDPVDGGEILVLRVPSSQLIDTMRELRSVRAVIEPGREISSAIASAATQAGLQVLSSESTKGLDFDTAAVLNLGQTVAAIHSLATTKGGKPLALERARSLADHARVAVSRAVSRLVLVEVMEGGPRDIVVGQAIKEVLDLRDEDGEGYTPETIQVEDLSERIQVDTGDAVGRMVDELRVSEELLERDPSASLVRAEAAYAALVRAGRAAAVGKDLRDRVFAQRGLAHLACAQLEDEISRRDRELRDAQEALRRSGRAAVADSIANLRDLLKAQSGDTGRLRKAIELRQQLSETSTGIPWADKVFVVLVSSAVRRLVRLVAMDQSSLEPRRARELKAIWSQLEDGAEPPDVRALKIRTLESLASARSDAESVLDTLNAFEDDASPRLKALASETLERSDTPELWAACGNAIRGLKFLRDRGHIREAMAFAEAHSLPAGDGLVTAARLVAALELYGGLSPRDLTPSERESLESELLNYVPVRGRR